MAHEDRDLLPLGSTFDVTRRGYDRRQVEEHLDRLDADLRILAADRDAAVARAAELAKQLDNQRAQLVANEREMARLAAAPTSMEAMSERLQRMLRLAQDEASEIQARAEAEAAELMTRAETDGGALRDRYQRLIAEMDDRRADMEDEHRAVMEKARAEASRIVADATDQARQTELESEARRRQVEEDFEIAMSSRRSEAMRGLAEQETTSKAEAHRRVSAATEEADRRVREATEEATRMVAEAEADVDRLRTLRARISLQLRQVQSILAEVTEVVEPLPDERPPGFEPAASEPGREPAADATRPVAAGDGRPADEGAGDQPGTADEPTRAMSKARARQVVANRR